MNMYLATTYYVLVLNCIVAIVLMSLLNIGKANRSTIVITGIVSFTYIILEHWGIGGKNIFPSDISGTVFFGIILIGA